MAAGKIDLTALDTRNVKTSRGWVQGYNAQVVTTEDQIVMAAEVNVDSRDLGHLEPMVSAARIELARRASRSRPRWCSATPATWRSRSDRYLGSSMLDRA